MDRVFRERALLCSRFYKPLNSLMSYYFPTEINQHTISTDDNDVVVGDDGNNSIVTTSSLTANRQHKSIESSLMPVNKKRNDVGDDENEIWLMFNHPCGFIQPKLKTCQPFNCYTDTDSRATVSLALLNSNSHYLIDYANKLPLMCVNVRRFKYTIKTIQYAADRIDLTQLYCNYMDTTEVNDVVTLALNFLVHHDLKSLNLKDPPNLRFSTFLHRLKLTGYIDYIFTLAKTLHFDVDFVYVNTTTSQWGDRDKNGGATVFQYKLDERLKIRPIGVLTVVYVKSKNDESEWFVYIHPKSLLLFI